MRVSLWRLMRPCSRLEGMIARMTGLSIEFSKSGHSRVVIVRFNEGMNMVNIGFTLALLGIMAELDDFIDYFATFSSSSSVHSHSYITF